MAVVTPFYVGAPYTFRRKASRPVVMDCLTHRVSNAGAVHALFSLGKQQASRYGKSTGPKVRIGHVYAVDRSDGESLYVKLYDQSPGPDGVRVFWGKVVREPDWAR